MATIRTVPCFVVLSALCGAWLAAAHGQEADAGKGSPPDAKTALAELNPLIGEWRGVGQPQRGSQRGAWTEKATWVWDFADKKTAVRYEVSNGKLLKVGVLTYDTTSQTYVLEATLADGTARRYSGRLEKDKLSLESPADEAGQIHRVTITRLNPKRTLVLFERRRAGSDHFLRVAEVGYTRAGTSLAQEGSGGRQCIVTGGEGTIPVQYQGKTYYVCCTGCKQAFEDDPEGIIAEYKRRLAEKK